jgi:hypothetical protein
MCAHVGTPQIPVKMGLKTNGIPRGNTGHHKFTTSDERTEKIRKRHKKTLEKVSKCAKG